MKQRVKRPIETRQALLDAAGVEFAAHGYAGTGIGAITARAGLTKGALFHHFSDKRGLAEAWVSESLSAEMERQWGAPLAAAGSLATLKSFTRAKVMAMDSTDPLAVWVLMASESSGVGEGFSNVLETVAAGLRGGIVSALEAGKTSGWIHPSIRPEDEASFLSAALAGFTVSFRTERGQATRRRCADSLEAYLETLRAS